MQAQLAVHGFEAGNPQARGLVLVLDVFLGGFEVIAGQGVALVVDEVVVGSGLFTIAMVRLVVDREDVLQSHQFRHDPLKHLAFSFLRVQPAAGAALQ